MLEKIFYEYEKCLSSSTKISFLHKCLFEAKGDLCKTNILNCLIALENKCITSKDINNNKGIIKLCQEYFNEVESEKNWWIFTKGIVYLKLGKYNIECCNKSKDLLESLLSVSEFKDKPTCLMFCLGHVYYEIGKLDNNRDTSVNFFKEAIKCFEEIKCNDSEYKAIIKNMLGNIYVKLENLSRNNKKLYSNSEILYKEALDLYPGFVYPYNGMGNIYRERGKYDEAIRYYKEAAKRDDKFMYPWNYMGDCFRYLEKYDVASSCFHKAIDICSDESVILPLYGLGRIYYELGNRNNNNEKYYYKAIEFFNMVEKKVITPIPQIRFTLKDLAQVYQKLGYYKKAIEKYQKIIENQMFSKQKYYDDLIKCDLKTCEDKLNFIKKCTSSSTDSKKDPANYIMCQTALQGIEKRVNDMKASFEINFLRREKMEISSFNKLKSDCSDNIILKEFLGNVESNQIFLEVLRRWNSYTPIIRDGRGGGYFLKVNDIGVVIDPGFNFIKNFKESGHSFSEIDIILITHSHDDHTSDLESILNLQHRYNSLLHETVLVRDLAKELRISTQEIQNNMKNQEIIDDKYSKCKKKLILFASEGVLCKYSGIFAGKSKQIEEGVTCNEIFKNSNPSYAEYEFFYKSLNSGDKIIINEELTIQAIKANHNDLIPNKQCLGLIMELKDVIIVYTGDTGWYDNRKESLQKQYEYIRERNTKSKKIVLIAHLGGFTNKENKYWNYSESNNADCETQMYYKYHLGRLGLVRLVEALQPNICLISEFGEEFNGLRIKIAEIFTQAFTRFNNKTDFLPADIGLCLNLNYETTTKHDKGSPKIKAISGIDFKNKSILYDYIDVKDVSIGEFRDGNSLFYYKNMINATESDCIQALIEGYIDDTEITGTSLKLDF